MRTTLLIGGICTFLMGCMVALQPRTTLDGAPFQEESIPSVKVGQTEADVRSLLGKPFQELTASDVTVWRYYERYTPRGCNPPMLTREFRVSFRRGVVVQVGADRPSSSRQQLGSRS